jgi:long-chain fatty acid transport protein
MSPCLLCLAWKRFAHTVLPTIFIALATLILACALHPATSHAQGFGVYEQGTCVMSRAGAGVASTCGDASDIFFNPAGLVHTEGTVISLGTTVIAAGGSFTDDYTQQTTDLQNSPIPAPHLYAAHRFSPNLALGLGVFVPYGLATEWDRDFEGAFEGYDNSVESVYIQPTVSYQLTDRISVGGGPTVVMGTVELNQVVDLSSQNLPGSDLTFGSVGVPFHTAFADSKLDGDWAFGLGAHVGVQVKATERVRFGARFMAPVELNYTGTATFNQLSTGLPTTPQLSEILGQPVTVFPDLDALLRDQFAEGSVLGTQSIETSLTMPMQVVLGTSVEATDRLTLMVDYQWTQWSSFDQIVIEFENQDEPVIRNENYGDTNAIRIGAEYALSEDWTVRGGYLFNQAAAPDEVVTPLLPENDRNHFTVGAGWQTSDLLRVNASYQYLGQNDRRGRTRGLAEGRPDTNGLYSFDAHLFGLTATFSL